MGNTLEQRQRKGGRFAGPGGGLAKQVASCEQRRDGFSLDRRGLLVSQLLECGEQ